VIRSSNPSAPDALAPSLTAAFVGGTSWPVDDASLAALVDMGLSNRQIGAYFAVGADDVHMLREQYDVQNAWPD